MNLIKILLTLVSLPGITSCFPRTDYYEYEVAHFHTNKGMFAISLNSHEKIIQRNGREVYISANPYYFNAQYYPKNNTILYGSIRDVKIVSPETGELLFTKDIVIDARRKSLEKHKDNPESSNVAMRASKQKVMLGFGGEIPSDMPHHDLLVSFDFFVYKNTNELFESGSVKSVVKKDYYKATSRRSDAL